MARTLSAVLTVACTSAACVPCADDVGFAADLTSIDFDAQSSWPAGSYRISLRIDDDEHHCDVTLPSARTDAETCSSDTALDFPPEGDTRSAVISIAVERSLPTEVIGVIIERDGVSLLDEELSSWEEETKRHEERGRVCETATSANAALELPW